MNERDISLIRVLLDSQYLRKVWMYILFMLIFAVLYECFSFLTMFTSSYLFKSLNEFNERSFRTYLVLSFLLVTIQAGIQSCKVYTRDICGIRLRESIVNHLHTRFFTLPKDFRYLFETVIESTSLSILPSTGSSSNKLSLPSLTESKILTNVDQRLTADVEAFCENAVKIIEKVIITPFIILFYVFYLMWFVNLLAPLYCFLYFIVGSIVCHYFALQIIPFSYYQSQYEGDFRLFHVSFIGSLENIILLFGGQCERLQMNSYFQKLLENKSFLIWKEFLLNFFTYWFDYGGTSVCYAIVGLALFHHKEMAENSSERIVLWSRGVYSSIALISAFSSIIDSLQWYSLAKAAMKRIDEFLYKTRNSSVPSLDGDDLHLEQPSESYSWQKPKNHRAKGKERQGEDDLEEQLLQPGIEVVSSSSVRYAENKSTTCRICCSASLSSPFQLSIQYLDLYSKDHKKKLIHSLNLSMASQMRLLVSGPTGSGKSTLLKTIATMIVRQYNQEMVLYCPQQSYFMIKVST
jgi:ABC-type uncharacterized transport system fused permease/ATPase subunit